MTNGHLAEPAYDSYESLAGDMWNQLENLRSVWGDTEDAYATEALIERYERLQGWLVRP